MVDKNSIAEVKLWGSTGKHLNIFKTYTKDNRSYQLENDLTRS